MRLLVASTSSLLAALAPAVTQEFTLEPANLRGVMVAAAREWCLGEVDPAEVDPAEVDLRAWEPTLDLAPSGPWRVVPTVPLAPAERLSLAVTLLPGEWTWTRTGTGARLCARDDAEQDVSDAILERETVTIARLPGEPLVETLLRLGEASEIDLVLGTDVERALPDGGRAELAFGALREATLRDHLDRLLAPHLERANRAGRVLVVSGTRAAALVDAEAAELDLRRKLGDRMPLELGPGATVGDLMKQLRAAIDAPVLLDPGGGERLNPTHPVGAVVSGHVPVRTALWLLDHATGMRACVVGNAVWLVMGERARILALGPWGDVVLEHELHRWPLALPRDARRLLDAPALIAKEGLAFALEERRAKTLARFDMELAPPRVGTSTVAGVLDRLSGACGAGGWHVHRGEIRFGPTPREVPGSRDR